MLSAFVQGLSRRVPSTCAVCHAWPSQALCEDCVQAFAQPVQRCPGCALPIPDTMARCRRCTAHPPAWDLALAAVDYAYPWDRLIAHFKFQEHPAWARHFAALMHTTPWVEPALDATDMVIPMPLATERLRQRGFNQSALLARQLSPAKTREGLLLRIINTPAQHALDRQDRQQNVRNAFAMEPSRHQEVAGQRIVLVDDVMTSGASMEAACTALQQAGAAHITALVFARTGMDARLA